jgi:cytochrome c peroxidase
MFGYSPDDAPLPAHFLRSPAGTVFRVDDAARDGRITNAGATLGRVLFYDTRLSANDRLSCASCHVQAYGFGDTLRFSRGLAGSPPRRTMALANARFSAGGRFFWDERAPSLEAQVLMPVENPLELGTDLEVLERKLAAESFYPRLFAAAFGSPDVTRDRIASALAQFVRSMVSAGSPFDAALATGGAPDSTRLTEPQREGLRLFNSVGCVNCHRTVVQIADQASNTGLDAVAADPGAGRGRFKPPSLRNVSVRPPYMHDGRFATLQEVVAFYDHEIRDTPDLDPRLRAPSGRPRRLGLDETEMDALVAFLEALTDSAFLRDERLSNPFPCLRS